MFFTKFLPQLVAGSVAFCFSASALAQFSSDSALNLAIADRTGDQVQAKVRPTSDGGAYISWFDNHAGGYDVYLQRLDAQGNELWPHNGVLVADRSFSSTQDYGLAVDGSGNAILAFRDDRLGGVHITVNKISPAGALLWGTNGVQATNIGANPNSPRIAATSDGEYVVGWSEGNATKLQRLSNSGAPLWTPGGIALTPANGVGSFSLSDIQPSDGGSAIILIVRPVTTFLSNKHLYVQKFDPTGTALWNAGSPVIIYESGSVQNGYFPTFIADSTGGGGAIFCWYENSTPRNVYVQRLNAAGQEAFAHNGLAVAAAGPIRLSPSFAHDHTTGDSYVFWSETNSLQNLYGLWGQRISQAGALEWGSLGINYIPLNANQISFINVVSAGANSGAMAFCQDRSGPAKIIGLGVNSSGGTLWNRAIIDACSVLSSKSRLTATLSTNGIAILAWGDGRNDGGDIFAQNVNPNGALGNITPPPSNPADLNDDGIVNVDDLLMLLAAWGDCQKDCPADIAPPPDGDGTVNVDDLLVLLANWG